MPDPASDPDERTRQFAAIRDHARRALIGLARDRGAEFINREASCGSGMTSRDLEPLIGARAARDFELGARHAARGYIRQAREAGHGWDRIGQALGVAPNADADQAGLSVAEAAYTLCGRKPLHRHRGPVRPVVPLAMPVLRPGDQRPRPDRRASRRRTRPHRRLPPASCGGRRVGRGLGGRAVTTQRARHSLVLADDGIIDLMAVKIATYGARPVALTSAERQLAAAQILAQGGTPYLISKPLHVRRDGRGWRTTSDALLPLSPAARTREHRRIAREELAHTI